VPHVARSQAIVAAKGDKVDIVLDLQVDPGANLAATADDACRRAHMLVEETMGVPLAGLPRARMHYRELQLRAPLTPAAAGGAPTAPPQQPSTGWERPGGADDGGS
jgi:hypothetical protein